MIELSKQVITCFSAIRKRVLAAAGPSQSGLRTVRPHRCRYETDTREICCERRLP